MGFITNKLKESLGLIYYLNTQTFQSMKLKKNNDYDGFYENKILLDFSDYPKDSKFFILIVRK